MKDSKAETYLGDIIENNTKQKANIEKRKLKGYGIVNNILAIVNEMPLSHWRIKAGLLLRQAMLVNGILFNSEAWHSLNSKDISVLEKVDEALLRGLLSAHSKTPIEALYLETNSVPLRYIIKNRRIMYLHNIFQKKEDELVRRIYEAQKADPSPGDFSELVKEDLTDIELDITDSEIMRETKNKFKNVVKTKTRNAAFKQLLEMKKNHSKMKSLEYEIFKVQDYLMSPLFNCESRNLLFRLRTRTVSGIRCDFKGVYKDTFCPLGCGERDTLPHLLTCLVLRKQHKSTNLSISDHKFEDIFSENIMIQKSATVILEQLLQLRNELMSQPEADISGPMHCDINYIALQSNNAFITSGK